MAPLAIVINNILTEKKHDFIRKLHQQNYREQKYRKRKPIIIKAVVNKERGAETHKFTCYMSIK